MRNLSEAELMRLVMEKHRPALEELYDRYVKLVYSFALKSVKQEQAAKDIVQLVFTRLWTTEAGYDSGKGQFVNWLLTVTRNISIDYNRKIRRQTAVIHADNRHWEQIADSAERQPEQLLGQKLLRERIREAYRTLSVDQARLIEHVYWEGYTLKEVADKNNEPIGTVKSRLHQTLKRLRKHMLAEREE